MTQAETKDLELLVTRSIQAPQDLAFRLFTECEYLKAWWAPKPWFVPECTIDLRPGGTWLYAMESPEGERHWSKGVYQEIDRPKRLAYVDSFADEAGETTSPEMQIVIEFQAAGAAETSISVYARFPTPEYRKQLIDMGMLEGFGMTFEQLAEYAASLPVKTAGA